MERMPPGAHVHRGACATVRISTGAPASRRACSEEGAPEATIHTPRDPRAFAPAAQAEHPLRRPSWTLLTPRHFPQSVLWTLPHARVWTLLTLRRVIPWTVLTQLIVDIE